MKLVGLVQESQLRPLAIVGHFGRPHEVVDRRPRGAKVRTLVSPGQKCRAPVRRIALGEPTPFGIAHDDEARQILGLAPQPVRHPRAHAREAHARHPRVHHEQGRRVVVRLGENGMEKCHLVDMLTKAREDLRNWLARLSPRRESERRLHQRPDLVLEEAGRVFERRVELADRLTVPTIEGRLVLPGIDLARPAVDEDPDHALRPSREVRRTRGHGVLRRHRRAQESVPLEQAGQTDQPETRPGACSNRRRETMAVKSRSLVPNNCGSFRLGTHGI